MTTNVQPHVLHLHIRDHIARNLVYSDTIDYDNDTSLISGGLVDSMGIMELLSYVSSEFGLTVDTHEVTPDNFDSVNKLAAFITRKSASMATAAIAGKD